jgi:hypothetical protein
MGMVHRCCLAGIEEQTSLNNVSKNTAEAGLARLTEFRPHHDHLSFYFSIV